MTDLDAQKTADTQAPPATPLPRRKGTRVRDDEAARCVVELLAEVAARVKHPPAVTPPESGMVRLGGRDRASYVWFLPCPEGTKDSSGAPIELCNHGIAVDSAYGGYEVRAWRHGAPEVYDISIHTHVVRLDHLETAARLVGIPLEPVLCGHGNVPDECEKWVADPEGCHPEGSRA